MKKVLIIIICVVTILGGIIYWKIVDEKNAIYEIEVKVFDRNSPDRKLSVLRNKKKIKFDSIYYMDDILLCKYINPTVNKFEIQSGEELKVKINKRKIIIAKIMKEK